MRTRSSSSNPIGESSPNPTTLNPKHRNRRRSKQPFILEESPVDTMADQPTMAELLRAPTKGYAKKLLKKYNPHDHIRWFNKITSTIKYKDVPNSAITLMLFPFSLAEAARCWLKKEPHHSILTWEDLVSKFINELFPLSRTKNLRNEISNFQQRFDESFHEAWDRYKDLLHACPHYGFTELNQLDTFYNALNPTDQDSLNSTAGGNLLERRTQDVLTIIENKSKQTSAVTTTMTAILKQFQATPRSASIKAIEEICVTCGGAHPYYQCAPRAIGNDSTTVPQIHKLILTGVAKRAPRYNHGDFGYRPPSVANQIRPSSFAQPNVQDNQNQFSQPQGYNRGNNFESRYILSSLNSTKSICSFKNEIKSLIQASMSNQTNELKNMMASFFQINTASTSGSGPLPSNTIANPKGKLKAITTQSGLGLDGASVPMPPPFINLEEDERVEETLTDPNLAEYTIKVPPPLYQKMLKALISNKEKLLELANTPLNENCSAVILNKLPKKLGDPGKFIIPYGFSELKCKALADLGASINLMPLSVWKKLGLPELISTNVTLELANRAICTPTGITREVFVPVGKFTFPTDFVIVDNESDPRVLLILGRPFLWIARALIDVHEEEMILRDDLFATNHLSGNPTFSSHTNLTSPKVINPLSGNPTSSSPDHLLEEFTDELALIIFPPGNDDLPFNIESDLREIECLLNHDPTKEMDSILEDSVDKYNLADPNNNLFDTILKMFTDGHTLDYSSPPLYDDFDDDLVELESDNDDAYNDPFDSKEDKIKESKLLIDELDPLRSSDFLPSPEYDSFLYEYFSEVDALPSSNNEDKVFNPGILIHENLFKVTVHVATDKNVKKISISNASLILENFNPPIYELPFHKEVPESKTLL
nr:hypothetical protein [Tanacetum cinerariifolium]GEW90154.1 hypothetical protein [Tanacetum cinerariifolium]